MAALVQDDLDSAKVKFCYMVDVRERVQVKRQLPWAFVTFPSTGDFYVMPLSGSQTVGLKMPGTEVLNPDFEYMRNSPFPHERDRGSLSPTSPDFKPGPSAVQFFGPV